jgi:hypothetical protein
MGDIFDFIRTQRWFEVKPEDRPWGSNGLKDIGSPDPSSKTGLHCLEILGKADVTRSKLRKMFPVSVERRPGKAERRRYSGAALYSLAVIPRVVRSTP